MDLSACNYHMRLFKPLFFTERFRDFRNLLMRLYKYSIDWKLLFYILSIINKMKNYQFCNFVFKQIRNIIHTHTHSHLEFEKYGYGQSFYPLELSRKITKPFKFIKTII